MRRSLTITVTVFIGSAAGQLVVPLANGLHRQVDAWGEDSVRIRVAPGPGVGQALVQGLLPTPPPSKQPVRAAERSLTHGNIVVTILEDGFARITRASDGRVLLEERAVSMEPNAGEGRATWQASLQFQGLEQEEFLYGFGEHRGSDRCRDQCTNATLPFKSWDWRIESSQDLQVLPNNGNAWIPFYTSSRGYGFLWNSAAFGSVHLGQDSVSWSSEATQQIDYWVTTTSASPEGAAAQPYRDLMRHYALATGPQPPLPDEYTGFWQCKLRYSSQDQLVRVAKEYVQRQLPLSVIVVDFHHWVHEGDWRFSDDPDVVNRTEGCWPDPTKMVQQLAELGVKCAVSVWPDVQTNSLNFPNMSAGGMLIRGADGQPMPSVEGEYYVDAFNPRARQYLFDQLVKGYVSKGIDTFWLDATEPEGANIGKWYYVLDDGKTYSDKEVGMAWVQQYHRMLREGLEQRSPGQKALPPFLTRSAFAGSQRYGAILWSGDIESTFDELAVQVQAAQHVAMSGIYLWTTDIGGFRNGNISDPVFRELVVRWFQFGAFCPIFRLHGARYGPPDVDKCGSNAYNEVWEFGDEAYAAISSVMRLRESLRPYVKEHLQLASEQGTPVLRPMTFDFGDAECVTAVDQFMFGEKYLVAPVLEYQAKSRSVYLPRLPQDEVWMSHYEVEGEPRQREGGARYTVDTSDISRFPLFVRARREELSLVV